MSWLMRHARALILVLCAVLLAVSYATSRLHTPPGSAEAEDRKIYGELKLIGTDGKPFDTASLKGRLRLVYFGYTFCPDACPTDLLRAGQLFDALGKDADRVAYTFITVDPARDTPEVMAAYLKDFDPRIIGLSGSEGDIKQAMKQYNVYAKKSDKGDPKYYLVDHTVLLYFLDAKTGLIRVYRAADSVDQIIAEIRAELKRGTP